MCALWEQLALTHNTVEGPVQAPHVHHAVLGGHLCVHCCFVVRSLHLEAPTVADGAKWYEALKVLIAAYKTNPDSLKL